MSFNKPTQTKIGSERRRVAADHTVNRANFISIIQRRRIQAGLPPLTDADAEAAASAEFQATLDAYNKS